MVMFEIDWKEEEMMKLHEEEVVSELILAKSHELDELDASIIKPPIPVPNMWSMDFIGLYCQYAAVGKWYSGNIFG
jgi:hypothetical protein